MGGEWDQAGERRLHLWIRRCLHRNLRQQRPSRRGKTRQSRRRGEVRKLEGGKTHQLQHHQGEKRSKSQVIIQSCTSYTKLHTQVAKQDNSTTYFLLPSTKCMNKNVSYKFNF